jgi:hypothetical protein
MDLSSVDVACVSCTCASIIKYRAMETYGVEAV